jgi:hypothetical protein
LFLFTTADLYVYFLSYLLYLLTGPRSSAAIFPHSSDKKQQQPTPQMTTISIDNVRHLQALYKACDEATPGAAEALANYMQHLEGQAAEARADAHAVEKALVRDEALEREVEREEEAQLFLSARQAPCVDFNDSGNGENNGIEKSEETDGNDEEEEVEEVEEDEVEDVEEDVVEEEVEEVEEGEEEGEEEEEGKEEEDEEKEKEVSFNFARVLSEEREVAEMIRDYLHTSHDVSCRFTGETKDYSYTRQARGKVDRRQFFFEAAAQQRCIIKGCDHVVESRFIVDVDRAKPHTLHFKCFEGAKHRSSKNAPRFTSLGRLARVLVACKQQKAQRIAAWRVKPMVENSEGDGAGKQCGDGAGGVGKRRASCCSGDVDAAGAGGGGGDNNSNNGNSRKRQKGSTDKVGALRLANVATARFFAHEFHKRCDEMRGAVVCSNLRPGNAATQREAEQQRMERDCDLHLLDAAVLETWRALFSRRFVYWSAQRHDATPAGNVALAAFRRGTENGVEERPDETDCDGNTLQMWLFYFDRIRGAVQTALVRCRLVGEDGRLEQAKSAEFVEEFFRPAQYRLVDVAYFVSDIDACDNADASASDARVVGDGGREKTTVANRAVAAHSLLVELSNGDADSTDALTFITPASIVLCRRLFGPEGGAPAGSSGSSDSNGSVPPKAKSNASPAGRDASQGKAKSKAVGKAKSTTGTKGISEGTKGISDGKAVGEAKFVSRVDPWTAPLDKGDGREDDDERLERMRAIYRNWQPRAWPTTHRLGLDGGGGGAAAAAAGGGGGGGGTTGRGGGDSAGGAGRGGAERSKTADEHHQMFCDGTFIKPLTAKIAATATPSYPRSCVSNAALIHAIEVGGDRGPSDAFIVLFGDRIRVTNGRFFYWSGHRFQQDEDNAACIVTLLSKALRNRFVALASQIENLRSTSGGGSGGSGGGGSCTSGGNHNASGGSGGCGKSNSDGKSPFIDIVNDWSSSCNKVAYALSVIFLFKDFITMIKSAPALIVAEHRWNSRKNVFAVLNGALELQLLPLTTRGESANRLPSPAIEKTQRRPYNVASASFAAPHDDESASAACAAPHDDESASASFAAPHDDESASAACAVRVLLFLVMLHRPRSHLHRRRLHRRLLHLLQHNPMRQQQHR